MLVQGQTVYTANAKTKTADKWKVLGQFPSQGKPEKRYILEDEAKRITTLPERCIFQSETEALAVLNK